MHRRTFLGAAGAFAVAGAIGAAAGAAGARPEVAVTMDDFNFADGPLLTAAERNRRVLAALAAHGARAAAFVLGRNAESDANRAMLAEWAKAGHLIGNHTYSHPQYSSSAFEAFAADAEKAEGVLSRLPGFERVFRFPYLDEGATAEQRDRMRAWLRARGYRNGAVTIDASDWYVDARMRERLKASPSADLSPYRDFYLAHMWERAQYYDGLAREALGRTVRHTMLVHFNLLNALFLGDLLSMFERQGWRVIGAREAFADPVFNAQPKTAPAGQSVLWAIAKETGRHAAPLRFPAEDGEYEKSRMDALGL